MTRFEQVVWQSLYVFGPWLSAHRSYVGKLARGLKSFGDGTCLIRSN
jgi:hypothetical protein